MSQIGRPIKSLEAPRPLKSLSRPIMPSAATYEVQSIEELITLTENVASALASGQSSADSMSILLANLRVHGPQLELVSKDTLDRAFVTFRNASQDERLTIIARMNLLELIELRAKSWQISDGVHTYYQHKASDVQPDIGAMIDLTLLGTSPPGGAAAVPMLNPGELLRNSGKFTKPTKIPGKNYSKDEVVIRNADSGKVMGIKGRRVHMIEELSETIISFQRVPAGAKERLVQITGPSEDKIVYAKQLIEDTIRRNASPVRLDAPPGGGSCNSLTSSASDEAAVVAAASTPAAIVGTGGSVADAQRQSVASMPQSGAYHQQLHHHHQQHHNGLPALKMARSTAGQQHQLLHSLSTNDATALGEYKYTVAVGQHSVKITGDCFELVRIAKLVLDDYFSSSDFLASVEAGAAYAEPQTPTTPSAHQLNATNSPFADSGIGLNFMGGAGGGGGGGRMGGVHGLGQSVECDDDVFVGENHTASHPSNSAIAAAVATSTPLNGLTRSRRSHFSRKDSTPDPTSSSNSTTAVTTTNATATNPIASGTAAAAAASSNSAKLSSSNGGATPALLAPTDGPRIVHEYERMLYYAKSPHSSALPKDWTLICERFPLIVRRAQSLVRFDPDKHLEAKRTGAIAATKQASPTTASNEPESSPSPDPQ